MTTSTEQRVRIKGHKLIRTYQGGTSGCVNGYCECGKWSFNGWTGRMSSVILSHNNHLWDVREERQKQNGAA